MPLQTINRIKDNLPDNLHKELYLPFLNHIYHTAYQSGVGQLNATWPQYGWVKNIA